MLVFLANFVWSLLIARIPAAANPWMARSLEWQLPTPVPVWNFDRPGADPVRAVRVRRPGGAARDGARAARRCGGGLTR